MAETKINSFGHYQVIAELGRGGMAVVYKCFEENLNRFVAIKVLSEHLAHDKEVKERFLREAKAMASINHNNVIKVHFIGEEKGQPYFAMEYIQGQSLAQLLKPSYALNLSHAKNILKQAASGLAAAHKKKLIHRDIKPANLMIAEDGSLKIVDFGIAQSQEFDKKLTSTGEMVGTPGYLSPEVCTGQKVDERADIFSLGIVFYQMLAGKVPFDNDSPLGLMLEVVEANIQDIRKINKKVDKKTAKLLQRMIARDPNLRVQTCAAIIEHLGKEISTSSIAEINNKQFKINFVTHATHTHNHSNDKATQLNQTTIQPSQVSHSLKKWHSGFFVLILLSALVFFGLSYEDKNTATDNDFVGNTSGQSATDGNTQPSFANEEHDLQSALEQQQAMEPAMKEEKAENSFTAEASFKCIEMFPVTITKNKVGLFRRQLQVPESLLKALRSKFIAAIGKNQQGLKIYATWQKRCPQAEQSYQFKVVVTRYKAAGRISKERIVLELNLLEKKNGKTIAQKRIVENDITQKLQANNSELLQKIKQFISAALVY